jgi:predicted nucleotidyltransferase
MVKIKIEFKPKEKIIKYLIENKKPLSIRETSSATAIDYKNAYNAVNSLCQSGAVILASPIGNVTPIQLNLALNQEILNVESKRTEEFLIKHPKLRLIREDIQEIGYPFMIILIFGSYAKGNASSSSDIDLCIISDNKEKVTKLINRFRLLSLKTEIQDFTTEEFLSMISKRENNLGQEIVKNNVLLYGAENYYNLISKRRE